MHKSQTWDVYPLKLRHRVNDEICEGGHEIPVGTKCCALSVFLGISARPQEHHPRTSTNESTSLTQATEAFYDGGSPEMF